MIRVPMDLEIVPLHLMVSWSLFRPHASGNAEGNKLELCVVASKHSYSHTNKHGHARRAGMKDAQLSSNFSNTQQ